MLVGTISKEARERLWGVEVEAIGGWTQGRSRKEAEAMLVDLVQTKLEVELGRTNVKVTVTVVGRDGPGSYTVIVDASEPALLAALVLRYQRNVRGLTLAEVAKLLGTESHNAYAAYEQGRREPSISKLRELLAAVAPEMTFTVGPRAPKRAKRATGRRATARKAG